ncbi:MAG: carbamoyltransferase C-terminal domain-containing protein, partial [Candidatus Uhrbacteria bacterium]|nr:carbamoyltransferase C-terminal domain-containing protein [Candidatus Uhrbacteria bacterium]
WWRPFATSVLEEQVTEYFEIDRPSPFMLMVAPVHKDKQAQIPSIVHVDGTCRIQTVNQKDNGIYYDLIKRFYDLTGIPLILNTSFNLAGEPIIETPEDALKDFVSTDLDYLVIENFLITKK